MHCCDEAANHQLPIAAAFWIIWIVSVEEWSSIMQNLIQIRCSSTVTQYTCSLNGVYRPHWLVQWSCYCSYMHIPVPSPWLLGYIDVTQTILFVLTMAALFLDRPHIMGKECLCLVTNLNVFCVFLSSIQVWLHSNLMIVLMMTRLIRDAAMEF